MTEPTVRGKWFVIGILAFIGVAVLIGSYLLATQLLPLK